LRALLLPKVWMIGAYFLCALTTSHAYGFSAPEILEGASGWTVGQVGDLVACFGLAGAAAMLLNGAHSDGSGERSFHCIIPCITIAFGYLVASYAHAPSVVIAALEASFIAFMSMQGPALAIPTEFLAGKAAAARIAVMNTITMFSGFIGPASMGIMKDATGSYQAGLRGLALPALGAAAFMFALSRSLKRRTAFRLAAATEIP
jgi:ACS family tartrate transporter-like MFS transporter